MASSITARRLSSLTPLSSLLFVQSNSVIKIVRDSLTIEQVGKKAFSLSCLPRPWTLPFIVVSADLLSLYKDAQENRAQLVANWADKIIEAALSAGLQLQDSIIVRSSGQSEGIEERGQFYSVQGHLSTILQPLNECLQKLASDKGLDDQKIPLILQKLAVPISSKGHLSNERRFSKENRDWLGEFEEIKQQAARPFSINLRNWRRRIPVEQLTGKILECNLKAHVPEVLKIPAAWTYSRGLRIHFEWVWDGVAVYLVQADQETEIRGIDPTKSQLTKRRITSDFVPKCLRSINKHHANRYHKISNVFTYMKLGLPITNFYVLDSQDIINELALGKVASALESDLSELIKDSLVIRMDIASDDINKRQLLPRTNEVRDIEAALLWLKEKSAQFKERAAGDDIVFIFHNFVPSTASAFALAAPGKRKVQVEALWGLPEGLYYNAHDKYIVDTLSKDLHNGNVSRFIVQERPSFKRYFVTPDKEGRWITQVLKPTYGWRGSIKNQEWVKEIAFESRRIVEEEGKALSIMWLIGVDEAVFARPVLPWYHEPFDTKIISRMPMRRTKTPFDKSLEIRTSGDIEVLRQEAEKPSSRVRLIRIRPQEEILLRDKNTLHIIGELAQKIDAVILLEGGVLSHAYYQLLLTNAVVEVAHPFNDFEDKREFNKLVRDKVPDNIVRGGELVRKTRLPGEHFLRALREKLVEEAFEVLDAADQDSIIGELADLREVIDGILSLLHVPKREVRKRQAQKREKVGGFEDGVVLLRTSNPLLTKKDAMQDSPLFGDSMQKELESVPFDIKAAGEFGQLIDKWTDRREHDAATEIMLRILVPLVRDNWTASTPETVLESDETNFIVGKMSGVRIGSKFQIELSIFYQRQLRLL